MNSYIIFAGTEVEVEARAGLHEAAAMALGKTTRRIVDLIHTRRVSMRKFLGGANSMTVADQFCIIIEQTD